MPTQRKTDCITDPQARMLAGIVYAGDRRQVRLGIRVDGSANTATALLIRGMIECRTGLPGWSDTIEQGDVLTITAAGYRAFAAWLEAKG